MGEEATIKEAQMQVFYKKYLADNPPTKTEKYELKMTSGKSIRWDRVADHQVQALLDPLQYHKIPDMASIGGYSSPKPYDCFVMVDVQGYVVVWFYKPRQPKVFHKIRIEDYLEAMSEAPRKSYREEDIEKISEKIKI